jgi:hypothetical protein
MALVQSSGAVCAVWSVGAVGSAGGGWRWWPPRSPARDAGWAVRRPAPAVSSVKPRCSAKGHQVLLRMALAPHHDLPPGRHGDAPPCAGRERRRHHAGEVGGGPGCAQEAGDAVADDRHGRRGRDDGSADERDRGGAVLGGEAGVGVRDRAGARAGGHEQQERRRGPEDGQGAPDAHAGARTGRGGERRHARSTTGSSSSPWPGKPLSTSRRVRCHRCASRSSRAACHRLSPRFIVTSGHSRGAGRSRSGGPGA